MTRALLSVLITLLTAVTGLCQYYELATKELKLVKGVSLLEESPLEAPFPAIVVTAEEIRRFGWNDLRELLEYLPSFYLIQDINERVISHRGIYRTITSHLLFLEDGFQLNIPMVNAFISDLSYSLYEVSRIEVFLGPGSSLYGDAAFTGVVNIEREAFPDVVAARAGLGSFGREELDFSFETSSNRGRLQLLFHYVDQKGELYETPSGSQYIHPFPQNYHALLKASTDSLEFFYARMLSEYETPRSQSGKFLTEADLKPFGSYERVLQDIVGIKGRFKIFGGEFEARAYFSGLSVDTPQVKRTHAEGNFLALDIEPKARSFRTEAVFRRSHQRGQFLAGFRAEYDFYEVTEKYFNGTYFERFHEGEEYNFALFLQEKLFLTPKLILNAGARYDHYEEFGGNLSPRVALVWRLREKLSASLSYGWGFQAPNFIYRNINKTSGYGALEKLEPELVKLLNLSITKRINEYSYGRLTLFATHSEKLLEYDAVNKVYRNLGHLDTLGLEVEGKYFSRRLIVFGNYSFLTVTKSSNVSNVAGERILDIPRWSAKAGLSLKVFEFPELYVSPKVRVFGRTYTGKEWLSPYAIWDLAVVARGAYFSFEVSVTNIFDERYERGGTVEVPYPWPGRAIIMRLEGRF